MQKITTFLTFNDRAEEAVNLYVSLFKNSKINTMVRSEGGPIPKGKVLHAAFELDGQNFMAMDGGPSFSFTQGFSLFADCETQDEIDHLWDSLTADGGKPIQCGWLVDKFGVSWQIVPSILGKLMQDKDPAKSQRVMEAMLKMIKLDIRGLQDAYDQA